MVVDYRMLGVAFPRNFLGGSSAENSSADMDLFYRQFLGSNVYRIAYIEDIDPA